MRLLSFLILACMTLTASARKKVPVADELKPGTVISGIVRRAGDMTPLKIACVREMDLNDSVYNRAFTDKDGRFSFELSGTGHVLMVDASGFYGEPEYDIVAMALDKSYYEITLEPYIGQEANPIMESRVREPHGMEYLFADVNGMRYLIDRDSKTALVSSCSYNTGTVFIPQEITYQNEAYTVNGIRNFAFYGSTGITGVFIPEGIESIGRCSFYGCTGLDNVILPRGIKSIGEAAFSGCTGLKSVLIPETVVSIGGWAFEGCTSLSFAIIPDGVTRIEPGTFVRCSGLTSVRIPESVTSIGRFAFGGCAALGFIHIPDSVRIIEEMAFEGCTSLKTVFIPQGVTGIERGMFRGCSGLTSVSISESVTSIGANAFDGCIGIPWIYIPESVNSIGRDAFKGTEWYNKMNGDGLVYVGNVAYEYRGKMPVNTTIILKEGTTGISEWAFNECVGLTSIVIPKSVKNIGDWAFYKCSNLTSIEIPEGVKETIWWRTELK